MHPSIIVHGSEPPRNVSCAIVIGGFVTGIDCYQLGTLDCITDRIIKLGSPMAPPPPACGDRPALKLDGDSRLSPRASEKNVLGSWALSSLEQT
jgi:hypothetical protein